jgi:DNA-binding response OmpR family regulator
MPIIFVTGQDDFESRIHSVLSGGNDLIAKPVFPIELLVKVVLTCSEAGCLPDGL